MPDQSRLASTTLSVGMLVGAMASIQIGATLAQRMFPLVGPQGGASLGPQGASALRLIFGTLMLTVALRPWRARPSPAAWRFILVYGVALGLMNLMIYQAMRRAPLGIAVAIEFTGPLAVALWGSRRKLDVVWVAIAVLGLAMLLPVGRTLTPLDPLGMAFALGAGVCWALYILFGQKAGAAQGVQTTALGMIIAAILVIPIGVAHAGAALLNPQAIFLGAAVGLLSTALPYTLEMVVLGRLPARTFGILMSLEPALGAVAGLVFLGQRLSPLQWLAVAAVMIASAGATATAGPRAPGLAPD